MAMSREQSAAEFQARMSALTNAVARSKELLANAKEKLARTRALTKAPTEETFSMFAALLERDGIRPALTYLLSLSDYRFLGIFRFEGGKAASVVHVDREMPEVLQTDEVPAEATYCSYIREGGTPFVTADASVDPRTAGHVAKDTIRSYSGVPVVTPEGDFIGTLCHYDLVPMDPDQLDLELLVRVSSALTYSGLVPDYPHSS